MTRHTFFSALLFFAFMSTTPAQVSIGVSGGPNVTFWKWYLNEIQTDIDFSPGPAWRAALQAEFQLTPMVNLRTELANQAFSNRLNNLTDNNGVVIPNSRLSEFYNTYGGALLAKVSPLGKTPGLYMIAGPGYARIANAWYRISANLIEGEEQSVKRDRDLSNDQIRRDQWLADVGIGYQLSFAGAKNHLSAEFRYQIGLSQISRSALVDSRLQSALLSLGYRRDL